MPHDVFISYSSHDKVLADAACRALEAQNIRCWIAPRDVLPGSLYGEALIDAINGARVMVLVLSSHSNESPQVAREVERAGSKGIPIIPLLTERLTLSKSLEFFVSSHHWLDAISPPLTEHLERLSQTVVSLLNSQRPASFSAGVPAAASPDLPSDSGLDAEVEHWKGPAISLYLCEAGQKERVQHFEANKGRRVVIGTDHSCEVTIGSDLVSRKHAMIMYEPNRGWTLCDLDSTNGSFLNGALVKGMRPVLLGSRDIIRVGSATILAEISLPEGETDFFEA